MQTGGTVGNSSEGCQVVFGDYISVYDIQRELAGTGQSVSINTLTLLLREEGFARLPRRLDDERPETLRPEPAGFLHGGVGAAIHPETSEVCKDFGSLFSCR